MNPKTTPKRQARYRRVPINWIDLHPELMTASGDAFRLYWYLRTGPRMGVLMGLCRLGPGGIMDDLGWALERITAALDELTADGLIHQDGRAIFIPGAVTACPPINGNVVKSMIFDLVSVPPGRPRDAYTVELESVLRETPWCDLLDGSSNGSDNDCGNDCGNGCNNDCRNRNPTQHNTTKAKAADAATVSTKIQEAAEAAVQAWNDRFGSRRTANGSVIQAVKAALKVCPDATAADFAAVVADRAREKWVDPKRTVIGSLIRAKNFAAHVERIREKGGDHDGFIEY